MFVWRVFLPTLSFLPLLPIDVCRSYYNLMSYTFFHVAATHKQWISRGTSWTLKRRWSPWLVKMSSCAWPSNYQTILGRTSEGPRRVWSNWGRSVDINIWAKWMFLLMVVCVFDMITNWRRSKHVWINLNQYDDNPYAKYMITLLCCYSSWLCDSLSSSLCAYCAYCK